MTLQYEPLLSGILLAFVFVHSAYGACASSSPIAGACVCHFAGACDWTQTPPAPLPNMAATAPPQGIKSNFARTTTNPNTAEICEGDLDSLAILYDCDLRIPLFSARVLTDADLLAPYSSKRMRTNFRKTNAIAELYKQNKGDYGPTAKDQFTCYETRAARRGTMYYETDWFPQALMYGPPPRVCTVGAAGKAKIEMGHMIASNYGKSAGNSKGTVRDTFYLSNVVPQFKYMNGVSWMRHEQMLLNWATNRCASTSPNRRNGRLFIIVGAIPSTFGNFHERYFGFPGFSDFQGRTGKVPLTTFPGAYKLEYRINVPAVMWTAACCEYEEQDPVTNNWDQKYITKAFFGTNKPLNPKVIPISPLSMLFPSICIATGACPATMDGITLFPNETRCI